MLLGLFEPGALLADKGYDADYFADSLIARAIKVLAILALAMITYLARPTAVLKQATAFFESIEID